MTEIYNPFLKTSKAQPIKEPVKEPVKNRWSQLEFEPEEDRDNRFTNNREFSDNSFNDRGRSTFHSRDGEERSRDRNPTFLRFSAVKHKKEVPKPTFNLESKKDEFPSL